MERVIPDEPHPKPVEGFMMNCKGPGSEYLKII